MIKLLSKIFPHLASDIDVRQSWIENNFHFGIICIKIILNITSCCNNNVFGSNRPFIITCRIHHEQCLIIKCLTNSRYIIASKFNWTWIPKLISQIEWNYIVINIVLLLKNVHHITVFTCWSSSWIRCEAEVSIPVVI